MTEMPPNASSSSPTEGGAPTPPEPEPPDYAGRFLKGCGCLVASVVLAVGVALAGNGDKASWGSGIIGIMFLILVVGSSGLTGFWNKK